MTNPERLARIELITRQIELLKANPATIPVVLEELRAELRGHLVLLEV